MKQIWIYVIISTAPHNKGVVLDYKEFPDYIQCAQYEETQPFKRNQAAGCMPSIQSER